MGNAENREKIISAAVNLSENTRLEQIGADVLARHSGISEEEVVRLFPDCPTLSTGIFQWTANKLMEQIEYAALRNKPPLEALEDVFHLHIAFLVNHPSLPPLLLQALSIPESSMALRDRITELLDTYESNLALLLHLAQRKSDIRPDLDPDVAARLFTCLTQGLAMRSITWGTADALLFEGRKVWRQYLHSIRN